MCARDQSAYDSAMDHIIAQCQQQPCPSENCDMCSYRSMTDAQIGTELNSNDSSRYGVIFFCLSVSFLVAAKDLQSIIEQQPIQTTARRREEDKHNRIRRVFSLKNNAEKQ